MAKEVLTDPHLERTGETEENGEARKAFARDAQLPNWPCRPCHKDTPQILDCSRSHGFAATVLSFTVVSICTICNSENTLVLMDLVRD